MKTYIIDHNNPIITESTCQKCYVCGQESVCIITTNNYIKWWCLKCNKKLEYINLKLCDEELLR